MEDHAHVLSIAAAEAVGEPDVISRRPNVIDALRELADDGNLRAEIARVAPEVFQDVNVEAAELADALEPYTARPLDDAPQLVERLALIAWALQRVADRQTTSEFPALAHA
jgi:hypothetical protein